MREPRSRFIQLLCALLVLAPGVGACASGRSAGEQGERGDLIEVQIINDLIPPQSVTVTIAPAHGGGRTLLGAVAPSRSRSFHYHVRTIGQEYVLTAEDTERHTITSRPVPLAAQDIVVWSLRNNQLELRG